MEAGTVWLLAGLLALAGGFALVVRPPWRGSQRPHAFSLRFQVAFWYLFFAAPLPLLMLAGRPIPVRLSASTPSEVGLATLVAGGALAVFAWVSAKTTPRASRKASERKVWNPDRLVVVVWVFFGLVVALAYAFARAVGGVTALFTIGYGVYQFTPGLGHLAVFMDWAASGLVLSAFAAAQPRATKRWTLWVPVLGMVLLLMVVASRRLLLFAVLGALAIWASRRRRPLPWSRFVLVAMVGFLILLPIGYLRSQPLGSWDVSRIEGAVASTFQEAGNAATVWGESTDVFASLPDVIQRVDSGKLPLEWGATYVNAPRIWLPRFIVPERPETVSEWYVRDTRPDAAESGGGRGFFFVSEAFLNFGWAGPPALMAAAGLVVRRLDSRVEGRRAPDLAHAFAIALVPSLMRIDFATGSKAILMTAVFPLLVVAVAQRIAWPPRLRGFLLLHPSTGGGGDAQAAPSLRVLLVGNAASIHLRSVHDMLAEKGHRVTVASFEEPAGATMPVRLLGSAGGPKVLRFARGITPLRRLVRELRPDVVNAHYVSSYGVLAALACPRPLVLTAWGSDVLILPTSRIHKAVMRWSLRKASLCTAVAPNVLDAMVGFAGVGDDARLVTNGTDLELFRMPTEGQARDVDIVSARLLSPVYRPQDLVEAVALLKRAPLRVELFGDGPMRAGLEGQAARSGLGQTISFHGRVPHAELAGWFARAKVYVSASESDGNSATLMEAMACGALPVVSDIHANRPWIRDGENGFLFPVGSPEQLGERLTRAFAQGPSRADWRQENRRQVAERASKDAALRALIEAYRDAIAAEAT